MSAANHRGKFAKSFWEEAAATMAVIGGMGEEALCRPQLAVRAAEHPRENFDGHRLSLAIGPAEGGRHCNPRASDRKAPPFGLK